MSTLKMQRGKAIERTCGPYAHHRRAGRGGPLQGLCQGGHAAVERPSGSPRPGKWIDRCRGSPACRWRKCSCAWRRI